jgi:cell division protein FtsB
MSYPLNSFQRKHRQKMRTKVLTYTTIFTMIGLVALFFYRFGEEQMAARVQQRVDEVAALRNERDDLHRQVVDLQADVLVKDAEIKELDTRYKQDIPDELTKQMITLLKEKMAEGVTSERLVTIISAASNPRNCRERTIKRFMLSTTLNQGKDSSASFGNGVITLAGEGKTAKSDDNRPEAWFDPAQPVSMKFKLIGGRVTVAEGLLPLQHSVIDDAVEYRFTIQAGPRGFVEVTGDQCDYP